MGILFLVNTCRHRLEMLSGDGLEVWLLDSDTSGFEADVLKQTLGRTSLLNPGIIICKVGTRMALHPEKCPGRWVEMPGPMLAESTPISNIHMISDYSHLLAVR